MAFKGKMKKESEDENKTKKKNINYEVLDCSLALKTLTADYNERIAKLSKLYDATFNEHTKIYDQINVFRENLQQEQTQEHKQQHAEISENEYEPDKIAMLLKEKEEGIQELEMKKYEEEQKHDELERE